jgi:2-oxoglutarate ferredoxin oxidoreductase subunit alpha
MAEMMKGNVAIAEAAVRAGVRFYAGYPITPSSEIMEYLAKRLPELGRQFIQSESELAAINMVMGAAACGVRALTASSGPDQPEQEGVSSSR